ncbi:MAG: type II and III secretion system protein, partial [Candidatus Omnitrophica bacterium]|nr:type II and III secretion system protein [Candidatus Omnitrophota bacterium]
RTTRFPFGFLGDGIAPTSSTPFTAGTLNVSKFQGLLQAIEKDSDTKILARPKVLTLDNESAIIRLTSDEAIGFQTTTGEQTATTTAQPERTTTGVVLVVTPQVNEDGYITMIVEPSVSKTVASKISPPTGQATPRDPKTRSSRTLVRIRSGDTLVVGGLIDRNEEEVLRHVPILSGIPFLGEAFKNTRVDNTASELVVFVTPRLLTETAGAQVASVGQAPFAAREQETSPSRGELIEQTLNQFDQPKL